MALASNGGRRCGSSADRYRSAHPDGAPNGRRIREIATECVRYAYLRVYILSTRSHLAAGGLDGQPEAGCRLYRLEGLNMHRKRPRRHVSCGASRTGLRVVAANNEWSIDFVVDALLNGKRIRAFDRDLRCDYVLSPCLSALQT